MSKCDNVINVQLIKIKCNCANNHALVGVDVNATHQYCYLLVFEELASQVVHLHLFIT